MVKRPDLAGNQYQDTSGKICLVDVDGTLRWIPNQTTYQNLFGGPSTQFNYIAQLKDNNAIDRGPDIPDGAMLATDPNLGAVYLIDQYNDNGYKRLITSPTAFQKFHFAQGQVTTVPAIVLSFARSGPNIT